MPKKATKQESEEQQAWREDEERNSSQSHSRSRQKEENKTKKTKGGRPSKRRHQQRIENHQNSQEQELSGEPENQDLQDINDKLQFLFIQIWINFFNFVGEQKGLVMTETERKQLKKSKEPLLKQIDWTPKHQWNQQRENEKLLKLMQLYDIELDQKAFNIFVKSSCIFAQEFTEEVYKILLNIYLIANQLPTIEERTSFANEIKQEKSEKKKQQIQEENELSLEKIQNEDHQASIERKLKLLGENVCQNQNNSYYLLSFQFKKKVKSRSSKPENIPTELQRKQAYYNLMSQIYHVVVDNLMEMKEEEML